jgi:hypothetical protein
MSVDRVVVTKIADSYEASAGTVAGFRGIWKQGNASPIVMGERVNNRLSVHQLKAALKGGR